jgi:hypothetical protein
MVFFLNKIDLIGGFMKKSKLALSLSILCSLYFLFSVLSVLYSFKLMSETTGNGQSLAPIAMGLAFVVFLPHAILMVLSVIFSWVGFGTNKTGFILTQAILTTIGILFWLPTWYLTLPIAIFSYVTYGFMIKAKKSFELNKTETIVVSS